MRPFKMANKNHKYRLNIDGAFFVDQSCIACDNCTKIAPDFFTFSEQSDYTYVYQQPLNKADTQKCLSALKSCPVVAIGYYP